MLAALLTAIHESRPDLTLYPRTVVEAVLLIEGPVGSMAAVARRLGLRNRFELGRLLGRDGLPPLRRLTAWVSLLSWVQSAERDGTPLFRLAMRSHRQPSACYRMVKEVTGLTWKEVRTRGSDWVERQLLLELGVSRG